MLNREGFSSQFGILFLVSGKQRHPFIAKLLATSTKLRLEIFPHTGGNQKFFILRPTVIPLGSLDLLFPEGFTVRRARVLFGGCAVADMAVDNDQRGPVCRLLEMIESLTSRSRSFALETRSTFHP